MTTASLVDAVLAKPEIRQLLLPTKVGGLGLAPAELKQQLQSFVSSCVVEVGLAHEWDFLIKSTTETTVAEEPDYTLSGANNDCMKIAAVKYNDSYLIYKTRDAMDDILGRGAVGAVAYWVPNGRSSDRFPIITLVSAPSEGGDTITYRYWRKNITIGGFDESFDVALEACLAKRMIPSYVVVYNNELRRLKAAFDRPGGFPDITVLDKATNAANVRNNALHGWG